MNSQAGRPDPGKERFSHQIGVFGAVVMGLGSILGTGVFVSLALAAQRTGPSVILSILIAGVLALLNGQNSAHLASVHPVSGGTYEYGYRFLHPILGFSAGWLFLVAKSASAATAALGFALYLIDFAELGAVDPRSIALAAASALTVLALLGMHRTKRANAVILALTVIGILAFGAWGLWRLVGRFSQEGADFLQPWLWGGPGASGLPALFEAAALVFVAYTGYGRIATMGEEVREPRKTIPRAMLIALVLTILLYVLVAVGLVAGAGPEGVRGIFAVLSGEDTRVLRTVVSVSAMAAMLGVLLNLILGLSRVVLAMGRRGDMPRIFAQLNETRTRPTAAVLLVCAVIFVLVAIGSIRLAWSFSAFTVLLYYGITGLSAARIPAEIRFQARGWGYAGMAGCLLLAVFIDVQIMLVGLGVLAAGLAWFAAARALGRRRT